MAKVLVTTTSVIPLAVMEVGVPSGLVMLQFKFTLQLFWPTEMVQEVGLGARLPDMGPGEVLHVLVAVSQVVPEAQLAVAVAVESC